MTQTQTCCVLSSFFCRAAVLFGMDPFFLLGGVGLEGNRKHTHTHKESFVGWGLVLVGSQQDSHPYSVYPCLDMYSCATGRRSRKGEVDLGMTEAGGL